MTTKRETVLLALLDLLTDQGLVVARNEPKVGDMPEEGYLVLHDGEPEEAETTLSPMTWHYQHAAQLDVFTADQPGGSSRDVSFDAICTAVGLAVAADRTLGGLCDWIEAGAPAVQSLEELGGPSIKAASIIITLHYSTTNPLG